MKKWKHLLKAVMAAGVIAMTAVQICAAAEGTAQAAASDAVSYTHLDVYKRQAPMCTVQPYRQLPH